MEVSTVGPHMSPEIDDVRSLMGSLNYLAQMTRPVLCYVAHALSSGFVKPSKFHFDQAKRCVSYLKATQKFGINYKSTLHQGDKFQLNLFSDAS
eukprot:snap_masked-scaffold_14-processed-gene-7.50-mRNA-1 protein AED:1.00 eAED:1.00 QI:0/-1/0/0/-1/1/1/0/93